jgi:glycosyltransferase involved in cell wall biosynthesis
VSTPDLLDVIPDAHHLPVALDLDRWSVEPRENTRNATFKIVHAPTDPDFKGTAYLLRAVEVLKAEGHDISLEVLREVPRDDALRRIAGADIFVDQLGVGWYGLAAVEAMALGVPTICHIRDDLAGYLTPLPLITASKMTIESTLRFVLANRDALPDYGSAGRRFVEKHHDSRAVVATLIDIYRRALS